MSAEKLPVTLNNTYIAAELELALGGNGHQEVIALFDCLFVSVGRDFSIAFGNNIDPCAARMRWRILISLLNKIKLDLFHLISRLRASFPSRGSLGEILLSTI